MTKETPGFEHISNTGAALLAVGEIVESKGKEQAVSLAHLQRKIFRH